MHWWLECAHYPKNKTNAAKPNWINVSNRSNYRYIWYTQLTSIYWTAPNDFPIFMVFFVFFFWSVSGTWITGSHWEIRTTTEYKSFHWRRTIHLSRFFETWCRKCTQHISCARLFVGRSRFLIGKSFVHWRGPFVGFEISCCIQFDVLYDGRQNQCGHIEISSGHLELYTMHLWHTTRWLRLRWS